MTLPKPLNKEIDVMKALETTATLSENGQLTLDEPLTLGINSRVRVIVLITASPFSPDLRNCKCCY